MLNMDQYTRATRAAQGLMSAGAPDLIVDGKWGKFTQSVYDRLTIGMRQQVDRMLSVLGTSTVELRDFREGLRKTEAPKGANTGSTFRDRVVPAMLAEAKRRGVIGSGAVAQMVLEAGWGGRTFNANDGSPSWNYAGIKWNTVKTAKKATVRTREVINGKSVYITDDFAVFNSPEEFAKAYFDYVLNSKRYASRGIAKAKSAAEWGKIVQAGGYATDPRYADLVADVAKSVEKRYGVSAMA